MVHLMGWIDLQVNIISSSRQIKQSRQLNYKATDSTMAEGLALLVGLRKGEQEKLETL